MIPFVTRKVSRSLLLGDFDSLVISGSQVISPEGQAVIAHEDGLGWRQPEVARSQWDNPEFGKFVWSELRFEIVA